MNSESTVALDLFVRWLNAEHGRHFHLEAHDDGRATAAEAADDPAAQRRVAIEVHPLIGPSQSAGWLHLRRQLEELLSDEIPTAIAVWVPAGAQLPSGEPATSEFFSRVRECALRLGPGERSYIPLPVSLYLRKTSDSGGVVSVSGGLNPHWARFTERVRGTYDLDSTRLYRLPESEEHLERLLDTIVERASELQAGHVAEIGTIDAWTLQRLPGERGAAIIGVAPEDYEDPGLAIRRNLRRVLASGSQLRDEEADLRALLLLGYYPRMEQEGATTAMRGYDPALYAGIDFICLVADGLVKPLIQPPASVLRRG